nr:MAG TPA: hypothetical protein [Caudoviricetes sp.]
MAFKFHRRSRVNYWSISIENIFNKDHKPLISFNSPEEMMAHLNTKDPVWVRAVDKLQDIVMFPSDLYHSIRIYFKNSKGNTHVLDGGLEKGQWYDLTYRIPHCLFFELDKFISQEKGLETHEWEKTITYNEDYGIGPEHELYGKLTDQAVAAIEQEEIWNWWKENKDKAEFGDAEYQKQEEEMLIRLTKIRGSLWS